MTAQEIAGRVARIRERLVAEDADALLVQSAVNRRYLSGFTGSAGTLVIARNGAWLLVDFRYVEQAKAQAPAYEIIRVTAEYDVPAFVEEKGFRRVVFEAARTTFSAHRRLAEKLPAVEWIPGEDWVERLRARKDAAEVAAIERAVALGDAAFQHLLGWIRPGVTEREIALELEFFLRRSGAESLAFPSIVASGPNGALPHAVPTERALRAGDLLTLDFGCVVDGYCSDMTRTVAIGAADSRARELYDLVLRAQEAALAAVAPGKTGREVDAVAREIIREAGYGEQFGHGLGHGLGMEVHEELPRLSPQSDVVLEPGMICSVEPGIYIPGWGGIRIEDLVLVTESGCRVLTQSPKAWTTL